MNKQATLLVNPRFVGMSLEEYEHKFVSKEKQREYELKAQLILSLIAERKKRLTFPKKVGRVERRT